MKILLVDGIKSKSSMVNLGLGFLAQYIRRQFPVTIISLAYHDTESIIEVGKDFDVIGFSCITEQYRACLSVAGKIKEKYPSKPIVFGGVHPTATYKTIIFRPEIDYICIGEGEISLLKLLQYLEGSLDISEVPGLAYVNVNGELSVTSPAFLDSLDEIGMPAWDLLERDVFSDTRNVLTARGCPYSCTYCYNSTMRKMAGFTYRRRGVESVIEECKLLKGEGIKYIAFADDLFLTDKDWISKFATMYSREIGISFGCASRPEMVLRRVDSLRELQAVGLKDVWIGIESGNEKIRKEILNRKMSNDEIVKSFQVIRGLGLQSKSYNIVGLPTENIKEIIDTFKINLKAKPDKMSYYTLMPYPGTRIWDIAQEMKLFAQSPDEEGYFDDTSNIQAGAAPVPGVLNTGPLNRYHIVSFRYLWYLCFYRSKWYRLDVHFKYILSFILWFGKGVVEQLRNPARES